MIKKGIKIFGILILTELLFFVSMILVNMTDEKPPAIGRIFYYALKYFFGFPLWLINGNYPFFLDSPQMPLEGIILIFINNSILAFVILQVIIFFNNSQNHNRQNGKI